MMQRWSSSEIVACERRAFWVDVVCRTLVNLRCEPTSAQEFFGEIDFDELGPLKLVSVRSVAQRVSRTGEPLGSPAGFFHVNIMQSGGGLMDQDGREAKLAPGGFVFFDSSRPYAIDFTDNFSAGVLRIPRSMLLQRIGVPECFTTLRVDPTSGLGAMVASMLRDLPNQLPTIPKTLHERVADNIVDLIAAALLSTGGRAGPRSARLTLTRVKFWIETHLAERLSGEEIADRCGLSLRQLNRLFEAEGISLMHYVWERRLARCWRDISDPAQRHRSITEIALANGFNNPSHFSRVFHTRFGTSVRTARREGV
jgi:AraC-like DNA-binding protein